MVDMPKIVVNVSVKAELERPEKYPWEAFLLVAQQNPFKGPRKPTDGDKKKKKKDKKDKSY